MLGLVYGGEGKMLRLLSDTKPNSSISKPSSETGWNMAKSDDNAEDKENQCDQWRVTILW